MESRRVPCVGAVVRDAEGRLLLVRRGTAPGRGQWSVPGGRVEAGEEPREAAAREVLEETGVQVAVGELVGVVERAGPGGMTYVIEDFLAVPVADALGKPHPTAGDDADEARWFTHDEVLGLDCVEGLVEALTGWGVLDPVLSPPARDPASSCPAAAPAGPAARRPATPGSSASAP